MNDTELNTLLRQLEAEFEAKYPFMTVSLRAQKSRKLYGVSVAIHKGKSNVAYYSCSFTENASITTLRRHLYNAVNKEGEEYVRRKKRIPKKSTSTV